jgi:sulfonate transport system permease protein
MHVYVSLKRSLGGFLLGSFLGVASGVVMGWSRFWDDFFDLPINFVRSIPKTALAPLFIVWFGIGELPKVLFVMLSALFPMYLDTFAGIRGVDSKLGELGHVLGLRRSEMIRHIVLPGALPQALTGLQLSVVASMLALVVGEQINASSGLGFMITQAQQFLNNSVIMVALIVYAILGLLANGAVRLLQRKALAWRRDFGQ